MNACSMGVLGALLTGTTKLNTTMQATLTTESKETSEQLDLFGQPVGTRETFARMSPIVTSKGNVVGQRIQFRQLFSEFKSALKDAGIRGDAAHARKSEFLRSSEKEQAWALFHLVSARMQAPSPEAPDGYMPEVIDLRKNFAQAKFLNIARARGDKKDTPKQQVAKLEAELAALRAQIAAQAEEKKALEAETKVISSES